MNLTIENTGDVYRLLSKLYFLNRCRLGLEGLISKKQVRRLFDLPPEAELTGWTFTQGKILDTEFFAAIKRGGDERTQKGTV